MIAYFALIVVICTICTIQVSTQAISRIGGETDEPVECVDGIRSLARAIERARVAVHRSDLKESEAVSRYRSNLEPEWSRRGAVEKACQGDKNRLRALDAVLHVGFAEEHAVRRDAVELASFRRRATDLIDKYLPPPDPESLPAGPAPSGSH
jgi:hypothetical protein